MSVPPEGGTPRPAWDDRPPVPGQRWIHVAVPRIGEPVRGTILSEGVVGVWLHWLTPVHRPPRGGSVPCVSPRERCDLCPIPTMVPHWTGYLSVWSWISRRHVLAELTPHALYTLPDLIPEDGKSLRGRSLELIRDGNRHNSPVAARWIEHAVDLVKLPQAADIREALIRLWGYPSCLGLAWDDLHGLECARAGRRDRRPA